MNQGIGKRTYHVCEGLAWKEQARYDLRKQINRDLRVLVVVVVVGGGAISFQSVPVDPPQNGKKEVDSEQRSLTT